MTYCDADLEQMLRKRGLSAREIAVYLDESLPRMRPLPKRAQRREPYTKTPTFDLVDELGRWRS